MGKSNKRKPKHGSGSTGERANSSATSPARGSSHLVNSDPFVYKKIPNLVRKSVDGGGATDLKYKVSFHTPIIYVI